MHHFLVYVLVHRVHSIKDEADQLINSLIKNIANGSVFEILACLFLIVVKRTLVMVVIPRQKVKRQSKRESMTDDTGTDD